MKIAGVESYHITSVEMADPDALTAEDLKNRLYHSLKDKGYVDSLKSQLRNKLVTELKHIGPPQPIVSGSVPSAQDGSLLLRASHSLVADHLRYTGLDYSLSVFLPETGTTQDKLFTTRDLLQLLHISPHCKLYQSLLTQTSSAYQKKGFLWQLLCELASLNGNAQRDSSVQTDDLKLPPISSLEEQFRRVDEYYANVSDGHKSRGMAVEERILAYQRQLDERSRTEIQLEMARFKENELSRMRMEEKEKCREQIEQARKEIDRTYRTKVDALLLRERHSIERLQKEQVMQEKDTYSQRQSLLSEIDSVRQREVQLRRQQEIDNREKVMLDEKIKTTEENVKRRETIARKLEIEYEQKIRDEVQRFKLEEQSRYLERSTNLEFREAKTKEDQRRLDDGLQEIHQVKDDLREKRIQVNELEGELHKTRHDLISAQKQSESLSGKIREMVDYQMLKEDNAVLRNEGESLKMRLAEVNRDNHFERQKQEELLREMSDRASKPTPEIRLLQQELDKVRNELQQERALSTHSRLQGDKRLQDEMARNQDLLQRFEEQCLQMKEMERNVADTRQQLQHTKHALNNEVYRKPRDQNDQRARKRRDISEFISQAESHADKDLNYTYRSGSMCDMDENDLMDPSLIRATTEPELLFSAGLAPRSSRHNERGGTPSSEDHTSSSVDLVKETKRRLRHLEKEADNLESNYRNFQFRVTTVHTSVDGPVSAPTPLVLPAHTLSPQRSYQHQAHQSLGVLDEPTRLDNTPQHSPLRGSHSGTNRSGRPVSSTPARATSSGINNDCYNPTQTSDPLLNNSMSTVRSTSPPPEIDLQPNRRTTGAASNRPLTMSDLEARPGSPSVMVVEGSHHSPPDADVHDVVSAERDIVSGGAAMSRDSLQPMSLDAAWKAKESERSAQEEERQYEEERVRRAEERERKREEKRLEEERNLQKLMGKQPEPEEPSVEVAEDEVDSLNEGEAAAEGEGAESGIDPVMLRYMQEIQKRKEQEKEIQKKTVEIWNKGRVERTPSQSEQDLSVAEDDKSSVGGEGDDFW